MLETRLQAVDGSGERLVVQLQREGEPFTAEYDNILVAVGRRPATGGLGLDNTAVELDEIGFVKVDAQRRTAEPSIFAVGDIAGQPMLAHKATHEGRMAAEAICCAPGVYAPRAIPAVVFTDPEIAWCGITGDAAGRSGMDVRIGTFPWQASGRAATLDQTRGLTKIIAAAEDGRVLGMGIAGQGAAELIGEGVLAMEMGAVAEDLALTIHAHPSLSETIMEAAENVLGHSTHSPLQSN